MAGNEGGNNRIADLMQGNPLTFGGIGIASWRHETEPHAEARPPARPFVAAGGFEVFMDDESLAPPEPRPRAKVFRPAAAAGAPGLVNDENRRPPETKLRTKALSQATVGNLQAYADDEHCPPETKMRAKTFGQTCVGDLQVYADENCPPESRTRAKTLDQASAGGFKVHVDEENAPPAERRPRPKTYGEAAAAGLRVRADETRQRGKALAPSAEEARPPRAQQRKQKLKQRPLQELQSTKRAALQPLPLATAARLPAAFDVHEDPLEPAALPQSQLLLCPAAAADAPMASPESLHSSLESIAISPHRGRLDRLFSYEEYAADLYRIMRHVELDHRPRADFMARQPDISVAMRSILVDWLVEVNDEYKLNAETLHLAVNYIDRFLSVMTVVRAKLQLVGTTALFIASKFEEIYPPTVSEFVYITDDTYTATQLKRMEHVMLKMLAFDMSAPTSNWFLNYYIDSGGAGEETVKHLAQFLLELTLVQYELCNRHVNSVQAASALCLARLSTGHEPWTPQLERVSGLNRDQLRPCVDHMLSVYQTARDLPQQAVVDKFAKDKFLGVSQLEPPTAISWA
ncbi:cyclin-A2-like [Pollicipes pollicipes]|uniref:cyclin-A2-like n=1 Tax=Pollicipes pollicipes TaxID=41117 RepID=UPI001884F9E5|nr:cyclin-A2-like [Pollicipes pollicipes]